MSRSECFVLQRHKEAGKEDEENVPNEHLRALDLTVYPVRPEQNEKAEAFAEVHEYGTVDAKTAVEVPCEEWQSTFRRCVLLCQEEICQMGYAIDES